MAETALAWLSHYGSVALFGLLLAGIFGAPVPDETLLVAAGALVARGALYPVPTAVAAILGSSAGITLSFLVGHLLGPPALRVIGRTFRLPEDALLRVHDWFARFGKWTLTFGYFVPGVRHLTAVAAGASSLSYRTFALFAYMGATLWATTFLSIGYSLGDRWPAIAGTVRSHALLTGGVVMAVGASVGIGWWWRRR